MSKSGANPVGPSEDAPERPSLTEASVPPRPSTVIEPEQRFRIPSQLLEAPSLPKPPTAPRVSQWLRRTGARSGRGGAAHDAPPVSEMPTVAWRLTWAVAFLVVGFGGGVLVAWLVGLI
jgi:hypothetical protein